MISIASKLILEFALADAKNPSRLDKSASDNSAFLTTDFYFS
jgi:hypothetical protein